MFAGTGRQPLISLPSCVLDCGIGYVTFDCTISGGGSVVTSEHLFGKGRYIDHVGLNLGVVAASCFVILLTTQLTRNCK